MIEFRLSSCFAEMFTWRVSLWAYIAFLWLLYLGGLCPLVLELSVLIVLLFPSAEHFISGRIFY